VQPYLDGAMRAHIGAFVPLERAPFFSIANHYEPMALFAHFYHWFDHAWMKNRARRQPDPPRRDEVQQSGTTARKAWRRRWRKSSSTPVTTTTIHGARRSSGSCWRSAARAGLASLYAQANEFDIAQAKAFQVEWTPRKWMRPDLDLLNFEQQLYLRQPGYGTAT
jgi:hypothetical protein